MKIAYRIIINNMEDERTDDERIGAQTMIRIDIELDEEKRNRDEKQQQSQRDLCRQEIDLY